MEYIEYDLSYLIDVCKDYTKGIDDSLHRKLKFLKKIFLKDKSLIKKFTEIEMEVNDIFLYLYP